MKCQSVEKKKQPNKKLAADRRQINRLTREIRRTATRQKGLDGTAARASMVRQAALGQIEWKKYRLNVTRRNYLMIYLSSKSHESKTHKFYTPCLKTNCTNCFCQNFVKFPSILILFRR